ncbi:MAG: hypothetical protein HYX68_23900 [Planctomycetes bacterium]|nr:hypothetical protein [Planctomycetota bacterium]
MSERGKPRPALFRALGKQEPPSFVEIDGETFHLLELFKHDSWAATAIYQGGAKKVVCKFNRQQSVLGFPMKWLGRWLARREAGHYRRLADLPSVPRLCGPVMLNGMELRFAVAHDFVEGHPLGRYEVVGEAFIHELKTAFEEVHRRQMAYVDLHKRENILVGADGKPHLIDFQVSFMLPEPTGLLGPFQRWFLRQLQWIDNYHLRKHERKLRTSLGEGTQALPAKPWWIRLHRLVARPLREARRRLLVLLGVRKNQGRATSEHFAEDAVRHGDHAKRAA